MSMIHRHTNTFTHMQCIQQQQNIYLGKINIQRVLFHRSKRKTSTKIIII